ncbi:type II secretion system protein [bacterium]|nr:type II secretion system protein [bacterium]
MKAGSKYAFTLAEVLITLGIIGVVAALTLPTLIANYQKQVSLTGLKKNYSILSQAIEFAQAEHGDDLKGWNSSDGPFQWYYNNQFLINVPNLFNYLSESVNFAKVVEVSFGGNANVTFCDLPDGQPYKWLDGKTNVNSGNGGYWSAAWAQLQDGSCWFIADTKRANSSQIMTNVMIDINGNKNPNRLGRDVFVLSINQNGKISGYAPGWYQSECKPGNNRAGEACAAKIIEDGWQIKKDYPW